MVGAFSRYDPLLRIRVKLQRSCSTPQWRELERHDGCLWEQRPRTSPGWAKMAPDGPEEVPNGRATQLYSYHFSFNCQHAHRRVPPQKGSTDSARWLREGSKRPPKGGHSHDREFTFALEKVIAQHEERPFRVHHHINMLLIFYTTSLSYLCPHTPRPPVCHEIMLSYYIITF